LLLLLLLTHAYRQSIPRQGQRSSTTLAAAAATPAPLLLLFMVAAAANHICHTHRWYCIAASWRCQQVPWRPSTQQLPLLNLLLRTLLLLLPPQTHVLRLSSSSRQQ
jgi:hypothetical protein